VKAQGANLKPLRPSLFRKCIQAFLPV